MGARWSQNFEKETDWNIVSTSQAGLGGRQIKQSRGRFLGGCSGVNGTICARGNKQDYDDWGLEGWSGDEMFRYMAKVRSLLPERFCFSAHAHIGLNPLIRQKRCTRSRGSHLCLTSTGQAGPCTSAFTALRP